MPNTIEQRVSEDEIYLKSSNGKEFYISKNEFKNIFNSFSGNRLSKITNTINQINKLIENSLGIEQIDIKNIYFEFDDLNNHKFIKLAIL